MARLQVPPLLAELQQPTCASSQVHALRCLKNEIIGHNQKKEWWITSGVAECLESILGTHRQSSKRRQRSTNGVTNGIPDGPRPDEEEARLQAIIVVGSLAQGGPVIVSALRASQIYSLLLDIVSPTESAPTLVLAALRSLNTIADAVLLEDPIRHSEEDAFARALYFDPHLQNLRQILDQDSGHPIIHQQVSLVASLISKTCKNETRRKQLRVFGFLDSLATRLASFIVCPGYSSIPGSFTTSNGPGIQPAGPKARLAPILQAICTIIQESKIRVSCFCCSAVFATIFPVDRDPYAWRVPPAQNARGDSSNISSETTMPSLGSQIAGRGSNYPPFNSLATLGKQQPSQRGYGSSSEFASTEGLGSRDDGETPLVAWLIEIVRTRAGLTRLMAIWLVALLYRANTVSPRRERGLSMLLIPILVSMLDKDVKISEDAEGFNGVSSPSFALRTVQQKTPRILALLIAENEDFQKAAADADVIKKLSQILKQSFDPLPLSITTPMWSPIPTNGRHDASEPPSSSVLGPPGLQPIAYHTLQMRESALVALAAMATSKDDHRKVIVEERVVQFIVESLQPYTKPSENGTQAPRGRSETDQKLGNPISILIAACTAVRALSRSVGQLRTTFVDQGLAKPIYELLRHAELEVRIAATAAVINIILEFSAIREQIIDAGVLKVLCEHAHSSNSKLRLNAIWALKHLVLSAPTQLKKSCVSELGIGWLKQIIYTGTEESGDHRGAGERGGTPIAMGTPNAAGEQVDLLNAMDDRLPHSSFHQDDEDDEVNMVDPVSRPDRYRTSRFTAVQHSDNYTSQYDPALKMRDDNDADLQIARDDLAIQEQGLTLVRNLICGPGSSDMVDFLFENLGQDQVFEMLTNLLTPKKANGYSSRRPGGSARPPVPPPTEIVTAVCYILVHLAASQPKHRQMLVARQRLLELMVPLFNHPHSEVRVCCVWTVINLTWTEDQADKMNCKNRALELKKLGVLTKLHELENDAELDVKERVKTAILQMNDQFRN